MQKHITTLFVIAALATAAHPFEGFAQDAAERAARVMAEARKAIGGDEKLRAVKALQASGEFRRSFGEMQMDGDLEIILETPDKLRRNEEISMPGGAMMVRTEKLNGDEVWDDSGQRGGMGAHGMKMVMRGPGGTADPERLREMQRTARRADVMRYSLAWLLASDAAVMHAGVAEAPDGKADVLEFTPAAGPTIRLFVDRQTHLPVMLSWKGPQPRVMMRRMAPGMSREDAEGAVREADATPPAEALFEMRLADYRKVDGIQLPHEITRSLNGQPNEEWTIKNYKVNPSLKPNTFTK